MISSLSSSQLFPLDIDTRSTSLSKYVARTEKNNPGLVLRINLMITFKRDEVDKGGKGEKVGDWLRGIGNTGNSSSYHLCYT